VSDRTVVYAGLDFPYVTTLLPNNTIEVHSIETMEVVHVIPAAHLTPSATPLPRSQATDRISLVSCLNGYLVPSTQRSDKMRLMAVQLVRPNSSKPQETEDSGPVDNGEDI